MFKLIAEAYEVLSDGESVVSDVDVHVCLLYKCGVCVCDTSPVPRHTYVSITVEMMSFSSFLSIISHPPPPPFLSLSLSSPPQHIQTFMYSSEEVCV